MPEEMQPMQALGIVEHAVVNAVQMPVSYAVVQQAMSVLRGAIVELTNNRDDATNGDDSNSG